MCVCVTEEYIFYQTSLDWTASLQFCEDTGGTLLNLDTNQKFEKISQQIDALGR